MLFSNVFPLQFKYMNLLNVIQVLPSLDISMSINHCPTQFEESLLQMDIVNQTPTENFRLGQLLVVSSEQDASAQLSNGSGQMSELLLAGQSVVCFFKLKVCDKTSRFKNWRLSSLENRYNIFKKTVREREREKRQSN